MADHEVYDNRRRSLEDAFFLKEEKKLIEKQKQLKELRLAKDQLAQASGITDDVILQKLVDLKVNADAVSALALVPLVLVAWADGEIQADERRAILSSAAKLGVEAGSVPFNLLELWLSRVPGPLMLDVWGHYVKALCKRLSAPEIAMLKSDLVGRARAVAEAAGGFLGLGSKVSDAEAKLLRKLEEAFGNS